MFTGLVECMGRVVSISRASSGVSVITVEAPVIASEIAAGESVSVSGACLTAVDSGGGVFRAQMMDETLRVTRLGAVKPGEYVNLERALKLGGRLDGHLVLGHVDEVGAVSRVEASGDARKIWISASEKISWGIAPKGSVAIDGVSLTVIDCESGSFSIGLIPTTLRETTLGSLERGKCVNIEIDVMARYIAKLCGREPKAGGVTWEKLAEYGW
ncbi:MAG: riboflavin synthase [Synergistaceae bacterium]|nr:riboflavin synthase [Synergistaceae bacterium]